MNPAQLNKRLAFSFGSIWSKKIIKTKRRDSDQNEEFYDFIVRKSSNFNEYTTFVCEGINYLVLSVDEYQKEKGFLLLKCEKSRIHSFYDTCTIKRYIDKEKANGADGYELVPIYTDIPCELVRIVSGSASESEQHNEVIQRFELFLENSIDIEIGDEIDVIHKFNTYNVLITSFFRTHTHQIVQIKMESEA